MADDAFALPARPAGLADAAVAAWSAPVVLPTYLPEPPGRYPAYLDRRVYQGSSGRVYPLPFHDRIGTERRDHAWCGLHLENTYLRVLILPELGGRIQLAQDLRTGYPLFYANPVIKPALVGLAGPWLAGGVELNWPQHHRPATFLPTAWEIEQPGPGEATVWCSDHDPFARMKGMHGVRLRASSTVLELRVRLFNRSDESQTFLWWANVAAEVHADYQSFFPDDVRVVADHAKRAVTGFPAATGTYYGIDYPARRSLDSRPDSRRRVPGDRLDWYRNIPVPTSYMCLDSAGDFFGGYDHRAEAGFVHWADHHYAVGKKQWTWGDSAFGRAWNANLADDGSAYIELMAGVFTDNQPDFSHLAPGESKAFSQYWYPIAETGPLSAATLDAALGVRVGEAHTDLVLDVTRTIADTTVTVAEAGSGAVLDQVTADLQPEWRLRRRVPTADAVRVEVRQRDRPLLHWTTPTDDAPVGDPPNPATEPAAPDQVASVEELYLIGLHLQQYRHATRSPEPYWAEALRRDPGHAPTHTALAARRYTVGAFDEAEQHARLAIARLTALNPNPTDGAAHYLLGLSLVRRGRDDEAYAAFAKAGWLHAWRVAAGLQLAVLDARRGRDDAALGRVTKALAADPEQLQARNLRTVLLRRRGRHAEAQADLDQTLALDPLDLWARWLAGRLDAERGLAEAQSVLDVALESARIGEYESAVELCTLAYERDAVRPLGQTACAVLADYHRAVALEAQGDRPGAAEARERARHGDRTWNFPSRLDDAAALQRALAADPEDPTAAALLGHWCYARGLADRAIELWEHSTAGDPSDPVVWRNLAIAMFNHRGDAEAAMAGYVRALAVAPTDARLWYESDQLLKRIGAPPASRLERLEQARVSPAGRDDLSVEYSHLLVVTGRPELALEVLTDRSFQPWEGGEGQTLRAWERARLALAEKALDGHDPGAALTHARAALDPPARLGEVRHPLVNPAQLLFVLGRAHQAAGEPAAALDCWRQAARANGDFAEMAPHAYSENTYFSVLAARQLGDDALADSLLTGLGQHVEVLAATPATVDYFATSLPALLLFDDDPQRRRDIAVDVLRAQLGILAGDREAAHAWVMRVLTLDPSHDLALHLASRLEARKEPS